MSRIPIKPLSARMSLLRFDLMAGGIRFTLPFSQSIFAKDEESLPTLNAMVHDGEVQNYAIGGAIAAVFYVEPFATQDIDVFVMMKTEPTGLVTTIPEWDFVEGWPVKNSGLSFRIETSNERRETY